jgi:hypothetical protein
VFSAEQELRVLETLRGLVLSVLAEHPTNCSHDQALHARLEALRRHGQVKGDLSIEVDDTSDPDGDGLTEQDQTYLQNLTPDSDAYWRLLNAVTYRLTRKNILIASLRQLDQLIAYFRAMTQLSEADCGSYAELWSTIVQDPPTISSAAREGHRGAGRTSGYEYTRMYRTYKWDATSPLQWPEFLEL